MEKKTWINPELTSMAINSGTNPSVYENLAYHS